jgi:hypothetical protein
VSAWLHSTSDYARLEDTFEPDIYRLAYYTEETEIENALTEYGRTTILFNCRPRAVPQERRDGDHDFRDFRNNIESDRLRLASADPRQLLRFRDDHRLERDSRQDLHDQFIKYKLIHLS